LRAIQEKVSQQTKVIYFSHFLSQCGFSCLFQVSDLKLKIIKSTEAIDNLQIAKECLAQLKEPVANERSSLNK
jgi:hypothetical protein